MNPTMLIDNNSRNLKWNHYYYMLQAAGFTAQEAVAFLGEHRHWLEN